MTPADLDLLALIARAGSGQMLRGDRAFFVETRLAPLARRLNWPTVGAMIEGFRASADETLARAMVEALTIAETSFFRDPAAFRLLGEEALPALAARRGDATIRLWSAGCSTGQEAWSLAMLLADPPPGMETARTSIVATDLSPRALEKAHAGLYTGFEVQRGLPIRLLLRCFDKSDDNWRINARLRPQVRFGRINLMEDFDRIGRPDVILCRHVLDHMDPEARFSVLERMAAVLADDGLLVLGEGETLELAGFDPVRPGVALFQRNPAYARAAA